MEIKIQLSNIVINYPDLRFDFINVKLLENIVRLEDDKFGASIHNQPNFKRVILPQSKKAIVITPDQKLLVEDLSGDEPNDSTLIKRYLPNALEVLKSAASRPSNYGFNYSVLISKVEKAVSSPALEKMFKGRKVLGIGHTIAYENSDRRFGLSFEPNPRDAKQYKVGLNAHYELEGKDLPTPSELQKQYVKNWEELTTVAKKLFK